MHFDDVTDRIIYESAFEGIEEAAEVFGYVLNAHHRNGCVGLPYDSCTIARGGHVIARAIVNEQYPVKK